MSRKISVNLTDEEYDQLMEMEGETKTDKIKNLINVNNEDNYFTEHFHMDNIKKFNVAEQGLMALGVLLIKAFDGEIPEKVRKVYMEKAYKGNFVPLYRAIMNQLYKTGKEQEYEDLCEFISLGLVFGQKNPVDDPAIFIIFGETLTKYFKL